MPRKYKVLALIGDGIAEEIVPEALKILRGAEKTFDFNLEILGPYPLGARYWIEHDKKTVWDPAITEDIILEADGIFKGPVGLPEWVGLMPRPYLPIDMRPDLDVYANIRPCRLRPGVDSVLARRRAGDIDYIILRENTEQMYVNIGGYLKRAGETEMAIDNYVQTRKGCERVIRYGFELASSGDYKGRAGAPLDGKRRLSCVGKWGICKGDDLFREVFREVAKDYPDVATDYAWVDAWSYWAIMRPNYYDVVVMPNQYGDIMSDMSGAIQGSMGLAGALNAGEKYCYAEPTHGSAPDIAGKGIANPISIILSVGMMLNWIGKKRGDSKLREAWKGIDRSVDSVLNSGKVRTPDLKGYNSTSQFAAAIAEALKSESN